MNAAASSAAVSFPESLYAGALKAISTIQRMPATTPKGVPDSRAAAIARQRPRATLTARASKPVTVRYAGKEIEIQARSGTTYELGGDLKLLTSK